MQVDDTYVCLGVDWSNIDQPALRMASRRSRASFLLSLPQSTLRFRLVDPGVRFCAGWFKLEDTAFTHVNCRRWAEVTSARQCRPCMQKEGFAYAHQAHRNPESLREDVRRYVMQPHFLYLAVFADGSVKVGTVAECRLAERLAEQGAFAATYLMHAADGLVARRAEEVISSSLGISQRLSTKRKIQALGGAVSPGRLRDCLDETVRQARAIIDKLDWVQNLDEPLRWTLPASALAAYASTPVEEYAVSLTEGQHSLYVNGVTGSIAVFGLQANATLLFAGDLSSLRGRELQFGDYHSPNQSVQSTLF